MPVLAACTGVKTKKYEETEDFLLILSGELGEDCPQGGDNAGLGRLVHAAPLLPKVGKNAFHKHASFPVLRIRDVYPGSEFFPSQIPDRIKEFKYFNPKNILLSSRKYDPGCSSRIRIFHPYRIPDPGVKKAPDPGSATLLLSNPCLQQEK
jgi:hypothetical protein